MINSLSSLDRESPDESLQAVNEINDAQSPGSIPLPAYRRRRVDEPTPLQMIDYMNERIVLSRLRIRMRSGARVYILRLILGLSVGTSYGALFQLLPKDLRCGGNAALKAQLRKARRGKLPLT